MSEFIHLHNHTHYSLLDAACSVDALIKATKDNNMNSVALTDHGVTFGLMEFYTKARKAGIKPILGCEVYMAVGSRFDKIATNTKAKTRNYYHLILLAKDLEGYRNLCKLTSRAHTEGFYYKPRIDRQLLSENYKGLVALSACAGGVVSSHLIREEIDLAREAIGWYKDVFKDDFYIEIQNHYLDVDKNILHHAPILAKEFGLKIIATNDVHYIKKEHAVAHNVLLHIRDASGKNALTGNEIETNLKYKTPEFYFKSVDEMKLMLGEFPDAFYSTLEVAEKCNVELPNDLHLPNFPIPTESKAVNLDSYLDEITWKGITSRYGENANEVVNERTKFELDVITRMGYAGYFLIVQDFISAAREMGVSVGPGRGSAAGSIVAYALGITNVDPLPYDLLFERFLNPDRVSMPDIDIDFSDTEREKVIEYVRQKYGNDAVAQIITFGTLSSRAVLKDVGRVLGVPLSVINSITEKITVKFGRVQPLKEAIENAELKWLKESDDPKIIKLIEYSLVLEGLCRNSSLHAAGVVIAPGPLENYIPLYQTPGRGLASQYTMNYLEEAGLLKMDFLGLRTLSMIDSALRLIKKRRSIEIDIDKIVLDDEKTYDMIGRGHTIGVFQFESVPMQEYLKQLKPSTLEDLTAMNALYRPGPMENIPEFIERKHGRKKIEYLHPMLTPILGKTNGITVYQEQIMQIAQKLGGFTLAQADNLRRAMGKKQIKYMDEMKPLYLEGCKINEIDKKISNEIWDMMVKFADYGFNKSHSLAYSYIAYQTAYLKANYTPEFLAANMTAESGDLAKVVRLIEEGKKFEIKTLPPNVNNSTLDFNVSENGDIIFGMAAIKNVGSGIVSELIKERELNGDYKSIFDFTKRLSSNSNVNKRLLESLVCSGAFDTLHSNRRACFEAIEASIQFAAAYSESKINGMNSLFGGNGLDNDLPEPSLPKFEDWNNMERLKRENEVLSFYVSGHPLQDYAIDVKAFSQIKFGDIDEIKDVNKVVRACGIISGVRTKLDKRENMMCFFTLEDFTGKGECICWSDSYKKNQKNINIGDVVFVVGKSDISGASELKIIVDDIIPINQARARYASAVAVNVYLNKVDYNDAILTKELMNKHRGDLQCIFRIYNDKNVVQGKWVSKLISITPNNEFIKGLQEIYGDDSIELIVG